MYSEATFKSKYIFFSEVENHTSFMIKHIDASPVLVQYLGIRAKVVLKTFLLFTEKKTKPLFKIDLFDDYYSTVKIYLSNIYNVFGEKFKLTKNYVSA